MKKQKVVEETNDTSFVMGILALVSCFLFWVLVPAVFISIGYGLLSKSSPKKQNAASVMLMIALVLTALKFFVVMVLMMIA